MKVTIRSFSFKRGLPSDAAGDGGGFVFDCRVLPNPFWDEALRYCSGCDVPIKCFMEAHRVAVEAFMGPVVALVENSLRVYAADGRTRLAVAFGCTGGQHRSVYCAERLAAQLRAKGGVEVEVEHAAQAYWKVQPTQNAPQ